MKKLIERFSSLVKGTITGFDRIVFKGFVLPLMYAKGAMQFCGMRGILNKNYKSWMIEQSAFISKAADEYGKKNCGKDVVSLPTWRIRKEELAHNQQKAEQIESGLIGIWSCLEAAFSYRARYCEKSGYPQLRSYQTRCKHLYFYFDHKDYGFMNIRLQTWFPYHIQVCLNGREWLRRSLERHNIEFLAHGNKFLHISDCDKAQTFLNKQLDVRFTKILDGFVPIVFPTMKEVLGPHLSYYWTMWQSEWATDLVLPSPAALNNIMDSLHPRAGSQTYPSPAAEANADGSTTIYFSPAQPEGVKRGNWIQTDPKKGWFTILRLYSPLESFFTKKWQPSEIELVK